MLELGSTTINKSPEAQRENNKEQMPKLKVDGSLNLRVANTPVQHQGRSTGVEEGRMARAREDMASNGSI
ncbi:hypothetical protein TIFTF001_002410 [Ficus carica]|uniref:Uncharacterized protein n=1 Tax=Ficus carica TaxID=3494 RepID=A0AA88CPB1_FICCA|nr:hypothetical protein TIFTF001_002410 [Ficus carica]